MLEHMCQNLHLRLPQRFV